MYSAGITNLSVSPNYLFSLLKVFLAGISACACSLYSNKQLNYDFVCFGFYFRAHFALFSIQFLTVGFEFISSTSCYLLWVLVNNSTAIPDTSINFLKLLIQFRVAGRQEPVSAVMRQEIRYAVDGFPAHHEANTETHRQTDIDFTFKPTV